MKDTPTKFTIKELKEEFILHSQLLAAAVDSGASVEQLSVIRNSIIEIIDQLQAKVLELKNNDTKG